MLMRRTRPNEREADLGGGGAGRTGVEKIQNSVYGKGRVGVGVTDEAAEITRGGRKRGIEGEGEEGESSVLRKIPRRHLS